MSKLTLPTFDSGAYSLVSFRFSVWLSLSLSRTGHGSGSGLRSAISKSPTPIRWTFVPALRLVPRT